MQRLAHSPGKSLFLSGERFQKVEKIPGGPRSGKKGEIFDEKCRAARQIQALEGHFSKGRCMKQKVAISEGAQGCP